MNNISRHFMPAGYQGNITCFLALFYN